MSADCPNCGVSAWGTSFRAKVTLGSDEDLDGVLCGECGIVYVPDPGEAYADHYDIGEEPVYNADK